MKKREMLILLLAYDIWVWSSRVTPEAPLSASEIIKALETIPTYKLLEMYRDKHGVEFSYQYEAMCN